MSRTDVHRPWWVQEHDPHNRHRFGVVTHHHVERDCWDPDSKRWLVIRLAPCDLNLPAPHSREERVRRCQRWPLFNACGCRMCTGHYFRRRRNRWERNAWRRERSRLQLRPPYAE